MVAPWLVGLGEGRADWADPSRQTQASQLRGRQGRMPFAEHPRTGAARIDPGYPDSIKDGLEEVPGPSGLVCDGFGSRYCPLISR